MKTTNEPKPVSAKKRRSPVERLITWGGIVLLIGVVVIEYRAKQGYAATLKRLGEASNGIRDVSMDEARNLIVGASSATGPTTGSNGETTYTYSWFSLLKGDTYKISLISDSKQVTLRSFHTPDFDEDPETLEAMHKAANELVDDGSNPPSIGAVPRQSSVPDSESPSGDAEDSTPANSGEVPPAPGIPGATGLNQR